MQSKTSSFVHRKDWLVFLFLKVKTHQDNPFGPYLLKLVDKKGENAHRHIHGTAGPWGKFGSTDYLGGDDPADRHFSHGCVRIPNKDLQNIIKNESIKTGGPGKGAQVIFKE